MIEIRCDDSCFSERKYIYDYIFTEVLGLEYTISTEQRSDLLLSINGQIISIDDSFFQLAKFDWLNGCTLPSLPLALFSTEALPEYEFSCSDALPVLFGDGSYTDDVHSIHIGIDLFGSAFFMLTRYEEVICCNRDKKGRFPFSESVAYKAGFNHRPIINEYIELLWYLIQKYQQNLQRKKRSPRLFVSHDVDTLFSVYRQPFKQVARMLLSDLLKRKDIRLAGRRGLAFLFALFGKYYCDPAYTFDVLMNVADEYEQRCSFYFIFLRELCNNSHYSCYGNSYLYNILASIAARGHSIGIHPSYGSYHDIEQLRNELENSSNVLSKEGVKEQVCSEGRQHGLQWDASVTWPLWDSLGLHCDSSVGYAEQPGFRAGICYEYPTYSLHDRKQLNLREKPLIFMDTTFNSYCNYSSREELQILNSLIEQCLMFDGDFVGLWHNCKLHYGHNMELLKHLYSTFALLKG